MLDRKSDISDILQVLNQYYKSPDVLHWTDALSYLLTMRLNVPPLSILDGLI